MEQQSQGSYNQNPSSQTVTNGKAITALVLGILSVMIPYVGFILGILAIIFAKMSFTELKKRNDGGKGLAVAGLVCGIVGTVLYGLILLVAILAFVNYYNMQV